MAAVKINIFFKRFNDNIELNERYYYTTSLLNGLSWSTLLLLNTVHVLRYLFVLYFIFHLAIALINIHYLYNIDA